jgi:hypothetical protein
VKGTVTKCVTGLGGSYVEGHYWPQGRTDDQYEGKFRIYGEDNGEPGFDDRIRIKLYDYSWNLLYDTHWVTIGGGNIQVEGLF